MKKIRVTGLCLLISLMTSFPGCIILQKKFRKSLDTASGTIMLQGLGKAVTISRDELGVPLVEAKNEKDLFFAAGYASASDRLWQMITMKMVSQGRLSEITGEDSLKLDILLRTLNIKSYVDKAMKRLDPRVLSILKSYAAGVNAYLKNHDQLPPEFRLTKYRPEPWKPEDSLYVFAALNLYISFNFIEELDFLLLASKLGYRKAAWLTPVYPDENIPFDEALKLSDVPPAELIGCAEKWKEIRSVLKKILPMGIPASNNWALSGRRTKSGRPMLANDTHLIISMPSAWMIMHLKCPSYNAAGVTVPGIPVISLGYNGSLAWGATMVQADSQDIFIEKLKLKNGKEYYLYKGRWYPVKERDEVITVKKKDPVTIKIKSTIHGALLNEALGGMPFPPEMPVQPLPVPTKFGLSLKWAMDDMGGTLTGFYRMAKERTMEGARNTLSRIKSIYLNVVYADRNNIAWQVSGSYPLRKAGKGLLPSPGWEGKYDWTGRVPFRKLPYKINPPIGFLSTANNRTVPKNYPVNLTSTWYHPDRNDRIRQVLSGMSNAVTEDMFRLQMDRHSPIAEKVQKLLFSSALSPEIKKAILSLKNSTDRNYAREALLFLHPDRFNAEMKKTSPSAAVLGCFLHSLVHDTFLDECGPEKSPTWQAFLDLNSVSYAAPEDHLVQRDDSPFWDDTATPEKETKAQIIARSLANAIRLCKERMGSDSDKWQWGKLHKYYWLHEINKKTSLLKKYLSRGSYPASGDSHTINVTTFTWGENFDIWLIPTMRLVVDFGRDDPAFLITVPGQSGHPSSPHYDSMLPLFLEGKNHPLPFRKKNMESQYRKRLHLVPAH